MKTDGEETKMRVLSIEIGVDLTHVIEVDYKTKNPKIYDYFTFQTPFGMIGDSGVKKNEEFRKLLQKQLNAKKIKTRKVIYVVNSGKIANREVEIPNVKETRVKELLNTNSAEYFPVDLTQYQLVYRLINSPELQKEKKRKVFVLAVPDELITSFIEFSSFCSLEIVGMDYVGNSVFQNMKREAGPNFYCTIKIDENATMITIINNGEVELQRTIFYGFSEAAAVIEESMVFRDKDYDYESIKEIMERETCINVRMDEKSQSDNGKLAQLRNEATESLRPMIGNISRVFDYYLTRNAGTEIKECVLIGNGANIAGLSLLMEKELNIPVLAMTVERSKIGGISRSMEISEYISCYGAALVPLEFSFGEKSATELTQIKQKRETLWSQIIFGLCGVAAIGVVAYALVSYFALSSEVDELRSERASLSYIQDIYDTFAAAEQRYADVKNMYDKTISTNDQLADAIEEMEAKLPSSIKISSFTSDNIGVTLDLTVGTKNEAAKVLEQLRTFEIFREVEISGLTEVTDEDGKKTVSMIVMCTYVGSEEELSDSTETTADSTEETGSEATNESQGE